MRYYIDRLNEHLSLILSSVFYNKNGKEVSEELFQILIEQVDFAI